MKLSRICLALAAAALATSASATVLNFEGLTASANNTLNSVAPNYGGFTWSNDYELFDTNAYGAPVGSNSYGIVNNFGNSPVGISSASSFDFTSAFFGGWTSNTPTSLVINAYDAGNVLINTTTISLSDNVGSVQTFNWTGVSSLEFVGGQFWTMDDFTFNANNSVPEPGSLALVALAILGAAGAARAKKRSA